MRKLNCFGDFCPIPLLKTIKEVDKLEPGEKLMVVVDHSCSVESISDHYKKSRHEITTNEVINGVYEIVIKKG